MAEFTPELFGAICDRIASGESLRSIVRDEDMPSKSTVMKWLKQDAELADQYARARQDQADHYVDEIIAIADDALDPQKARLQIDTRKWVASKLLPKVYGDKVSHEHGGPDGGAIPHSVKIEFGRAD
jgi:hypothetical protein